MMELKTENLLSPHPDTEMPTNWKNRRNLPSLVSDVQVGETSNGLDDFRDQVKGFEPRLNMPFLHAFLALHNIFEKLTLFD
jgi:hypothetical protein